MYKVNNRGFSLIELMVTISIFIMLTSFTLANYPKFSNKLSLDLLAQDLALSLRQAQIFGSSVLGSKSTGIPGQTKTFGAYGIHFQTPTPDLPAYTYLLFANISDSSFDTQNSIRRFNLDPEPGPGVPLDVNLPCGDPDQDNECLQKFLVSGRNKIKYLCANFIPLVDVPDRVANCAGDSNNQLNALDIVFVRPNLDAHLVPMDITGPIINVPISNVGIVLESPGGEYHKTIVVWKTGQISVE
ncbi:MAG: type II secretion system protein [bacterium]|nr:type II secretion system protein [bacterium]